jgi:two-component system OmpR family sensor kinase
MSLRSRLTWLYTSLMGGLILILGVVVYSMVSVDLVYAIDSLLERTANDIIRNARVDAVGNLDLVNLRTLNLTENLLIQVWGRDGRLLASSENVRQFSTSIDPIGAQATKPVYLDVSINQVHLRVLSVPLVVNQRQIGLLQVGNNLNLVDRTQRALLTVLVVTALLAMLLAGVISWLVIGHALAPLETVMHVAAKITAADDLSRRIPFSGPANDEVGQLIQAFNQTLSRLEHLFTAQRRFLTDVSHELRTPLTVIKGNIGLMRHIHSVDEESMVSIEGEVDRLTRLVGDLLLLAQAESGKIPLDMQPIELDTILLEVFQQMRVLAGDRVQVKLVEIDQVTVTGDRDRLKQVLLNLGGNAIKYTPAGGLIQIGLYRSENQARVVVSDNGPGISAEDLPHIFERFYRSEKSRTRSREYSGFGLGLSIAYWIVRNHGGRIEVDSREGQGTTFCVWLPLTNRL